MSNFITYDRSLNSNTSELKRYLALQKAGVKTHDFVVNNTKGAANFTMKVGRGFGVFLKAVATGK